MLNQRTKYIANADVGDDMIDILNNASHVQLHDTWYPVLGYDETDDILCAEGSIPAHDSIIPNASITLDWWNFKIAVLVTESDINSNNA